MLLKQFSNGISNDKYRMQICRCWFFSNGFVRCWFGSNGNSDAYNQQRIIRCSQTSNGFSFAYSSNGFSVANFSNGKCIAGFVNQQRIFRCWLMNCLQSVTENPLLTILFLLNFFLFIKMTFNLFNYLFMDILKVVEYI